MKHTIILLLFLCFHTCFSRFGGLGGSYYPISINGRDPYFTSYSHSLNPYQPVISISRGNYNDDVPYHDDNVPYVDLISTTEGTTTEGTSTSTTSAATVPRPTCGLRRIHHTGLIRNGSPTKPGDWPWHVALYRLNTRGMQQQYICGGSIIDQFRVVTAAHCVTERSAIILPERIIVYAGKNKLTDDDGESQERSVFKIIVHPDFSRAALSYDIAILKLSSSLIYDDYVQPICLWDRENNVKNRLFKKLGTVVGWGFTEDDRLSTQLMVTRLPVIDDVKCIQTNPLFYSKFVNDYSYCAGYNNGTSVCNGDSGSGMYFAESNYGGQEVWFLRGLVSLTASRKDTNICDPTQLTIFTDVAQFHDFLEEKL